MSNKILDSVQRLNRNIKRRKMSPFVPDTHGRAQGKTLRVVEENDGIRANLLAAMLDIRPSSLTEKLSKLESDGNIKRVRDPKDARVVRIYITELGKETLEARSKEREQINRDFSDCLTEKEKTVFCNLCNRLSDNLETILAEEKAQYEGVAILKSRPGKAAQAAKNDTENQIG